MEKSTSQILQEARALVAQGWCRGRTHVVSHGHHYYCIIGALHTAVHGEVRRHALQHPAVTVLEKTLKEAGHRSCLSYYNDALGRTQSDVLALFDAALTAVTK
jgi:hypothetical protein